MNRLKKISIIAGIIIIVTLPLMIVFSPYKKYGSNHFRSVDVSVLIYLSADSVYKYLGNSAYVFSSIFEKNLDNIKRLTEEKYPS